VRQGLRMQTHHFLSGENQGAEFKIDLGEDSKFWPCDEALAKLGLSVGLAPTGAAAAEGKKGPVPQIVYEAGA